MATLLETILWRRTAPKAAGASTPDSRRDLLEALPADSPDRGWVAETAQVLEDRRSRSPQLLLLQCEWEPGGDDHVAISACDRALSKDVRAGDSVSAGFVAIRDREGLRVLPRIYRKICANGAVVFLGSGRDALATHGSVPEAIGACFTKEGLGEVVAEFRRAAQVPVPDPAALLARARATTPAREVLPHYERAGDRTAWGLINAATAAARSEPNLSRRIDRERDAERILRALGSRAGRARPAVEAAEPAAAPGREALAPAGVS